MGEPNELAEGVGAINLAGGGFWKSWTAGSPACASSLLNNILQYQPTTNVTNSCLALHFKELPAVKISTKIFSKYLELACQARTIGLQILQRRHA
eukprot:g44460.t1